MRTEFLDETYKTRKAFEKLPETVSKVGLKADSPATLATRKKNHKCYFFPIFFDWLKTSNQKLCHS